jgi:MFS family permease
MTIQIPRDFRRVIVAASVGNVIEWYDFYIFGSLAAVLSVKFFEQSHPVAALLSTIALFTAGFLIRPLGAFLFGWMGDRVGRKYTFLVTLSGMGLGTGAIGLIPTYESIGLTAAFLLFGLRMIQGLCLGGEYGGAITYVAEHVPDESRGYYTGWLQTSPTLGIVVSLAVIIATRTYFGRRVADLVAVRPGLRRAEVWIPIALGLCVILFAVEGFVIPSYLEEWGEILIGLALVAVPWTVGYQSVSATASSVVSGILVILLAAWELTTDRDFSTWWHDRWHHSAS